MARIIRRNPTMVPFNEDVLGNIKSMTLGRQRVEIDD